MRQSPLTTPELRGSVRRLERVPRDSLGEVKDMDLMAYALAQAEQGLEAGAMPIGAVLVHGGEILAEAYWTGAGQGLLDHPEHTVLVRADSSIPFRARRAATLYTTLEPCLMCVGTAMSFFLGRIVYAMAALADGATNVTDQWCPTLGHPAGAGSYALPEIEGGVREAEARALVLSWLETGVTGPEADFARRTLG
jgi:tRNA(adenine34) deaminase